MRNKTALITGATAGIGKATAILLAQNNVNLIITGRRNHLLQELKQEILSKFQVQIVTLNFDIRNQKEVNSAIDSLQDDWKKIDILVNNAGLASGIGPIDKGDINDWEVMIDTNIKGLLYISRKIIPLMIENNTGQIINIGSVAGKEVYANGNVYCATKAAVDALTKGMRIDLLEHGIRVTSIHPGMVETEFSEVRFKGDKDKASKIYEGLTPLYATDIAETVLFVISRPAHVNVNDILIMPTVQASPNHLIRKEIK